MRLIIKDLTENIFDDILDQVHQCATENFGEAPTVIEINRKQKLRILLQCRTAMGQIEFSSNFELKTVHGFPIMIREERDNAKESGN